MGVTLVQRIAFRQLPRHLKSVLLALANYADDADGTECRPALATIAAWTGRSLVRTRVIMRELRRRGLIAVIRPHAPHRPPVYALRLERIEALPTCRRQAYQPDLFSTFPQVSTGVHRSPVIAVQRSPTIPDPLKGSVDQVPISRVRARGK